MAKAPDLSDYNEVAERIKEFHEKHPEGTLQSECNFTEVDGRSWVVVKAYAFRYPDDPRPGTGLAFEVIPGKTPYTRDSELQNAETAAWGRAVVAVGASTAKKIASREEVRNRTAAPVQSDGTVAFLKMAQERGLPLNDCADAFTKKFGVHPRQASDDDLHAFVALVGTGDIVVLPPVEVTDVTSGTG
jgi:hypothetical protein